jgi:hypothetical protein
MRSRQLYALLMLQLHPKQATGPGSFYCLADNFPWYRCIILRYIDGTRRARIRFRVFLCILPNRRLDFCAASNTMVAHADDTDMEKALIRVCKMQYLYRSCNHNPFCIPELHFSLTWSNIYAEEVSTFSNFNMQGLHRIE